MLLIEFYEDIYNKTVWNFLANLLNIVSVHVVSLVISCAWFIFNNLIYGAHYLSYVNNSVSHSCMINAKFSLLFYSCLSLFSSDVNVGG